LNAQGNNIDDFKRAHGAAGLHLAEKTPHGTMGGRRFRQARPLPEAGPDSPRLSPSNYFSSLTYTHTFSPGLLSEFIFTLQRQCPGPSCTILEPANAAHWVWAFTPDQSTVLRGFSLLLRTGYRIQPAGPTKLINQHVFLTAETVTWVRDGHLEIWRELYALTRTILSFDFFVNGQFDYDEFNGAFNPYANFLLGLPEDYFQFGSAPPTSGRSHLFFAPRRMAPGCAEPGAHAGHALTEFSSPQD